MSEVETKGRVALANLFGGREVKIGSEVVEVFDAEDPRDLEGAIQQLPQEIILYISSLAPHLPEFISDLLAEMIELLEEKEARRQLWEGFGVPKSTLAVPVFKRLNEDLGEAQEAVIERSQEAQFLARKFADVIEQISLFYAERLNLLEEDEEAHNDAITELNEMETWGSTMQQTTHKSAFGFEQKRKEIVRERTEAEAAQTGWHKRARQWLERLPIFQSFETPIDLARPNQAMAL